MAAAWTARLADDPRPGLIEEFGDIVVPSVQAARTVTGSRPRLSMTYIACACEVEAQVVDVLGGMHRGCAVQVLDDLHTALAVNRSAEGEAPGSSPPR